MKTAEIFQSGMVLQQGKPVNVWGTAAPGEEVSASIQGQTGSAQADVAGNFCITLNALTASDAETLTVYTADEKICFEQVAVGEVWIAGGQSNMEFQMVFEKHFAGEREQCENARLRFYDVPEVGFDGQREAFDYSKTAVWRKAAKQDIGYFSAAAYYFQKEIGKALDVPVGIVGCNWGGSRAVAWMKWESAETDGKFWMDDYRKKMGAMTLSEYAAEQAKNPMNARGDLTRDPFTAFMLPRTPSMEEIAAFFAEAGMGDPADGNPGAEQVQVNSVPAALYEHMLKPIAGFAVRGVLWYQGESDDEVEGGAEQYGRMLAALIRDWRELLGEELPFLVVQLPGWGDWMGISTEHYSVIRAHQEAVTRTVPNTYLCSISDAGEEHDIHPKNKKVVGERLALLALGHIYGKDCLCDAPVLSGAARQGSEITLTFTNAGDGLYIKGDALQALVITAGTGVQAGKQEKAAGRDAQTGKQEKAAGRDAQAAAKTGENVPAAGAQAADAPAQTEGNTLQAANAGTAAGALPFTARAEGDKLILTVDGASDEPLEIRFAKTRWYCVNLYNSAGVPAIPFEVSV